MTEQPSKIKRLLLTLFYLPMTIVFAIEMAWKMGRTGIYWPYDWEIKTKGRPLPTFLGKNL